MRRTTSFALAVLACAALFALARRAGAQACCAGAGALTPGRLSLHEDALVGTQMHAGTVLGSYDDGSHFVSSGAAGTRELDFEEDLFGAIRVLRRGQVALLVPLVETWRSDYQGYSEIGGGIGDVNLSARYDFFLAGQSRILPGIAVLAGVTAPTGRPPDKAHQVLATDATGVGAWQANGGVALEQIYGPWLFNVTQLVAWRAPRNVVSADQSVDEALAPQFVTLVGGAYSFHDEGSIALFGSYTVEGQAKVNGGPEPFSARHLAVVTLSAAHPLTDAWRLQGGLFMNPPFSSVGRNQTAAAGITFTLIRSWS
jgi:hypothetical protein